MTKKDHSQRRKTLEQWARIQHPEARVTAALKRRSVFERHNHPNDPEHQGGVGEGEE